MTDPIRMTVSRRRDHTSKLFFERTVAAQLHALGSVLTLLGASYLLPLAKKAGPEHFYGCLIFLITGFIVFTLSSVYHFLHDGFQISLRLETFLENLDHFGIYLFIAGTYTPFLLSAVTSGWKVPLLVLVWTTAATGIAYTCLKPRLPLMLQSRAVYTSLFVLMGWTLMIRIGEIASSLSSLTLGLLIAGGAAYSLGAVVYVTRKPRLLAGIFGYHELWHSMVLLGATFHFLMVLSLYPSPK